jgi:hypothetical protein
VAACGSDASSGPGGAGSTTPTTTPPTTPPTTPVEDLTLSPTTSAPIVELEGVVSAGVEAGCLVLTADSGAYTLVGRTAGIRAGERVRVRGAEAPDVATVCQQGTVFRVDAVL